jgi:hypothetical protein
MQKSVVLLGTARQCRRIRGSFGLDVEVVPRIIGSARRSGALKAIAPVWSIFTGCSRAAELVWQSF